MGEALHPPAIFINCLRNSFTAITSLNGRKENLYKQELINLGGMSEQNRRKADITEVAAGIISDGITLKWKDSVNTLSVYTLYVRIYIYI